MSSFDWLCLPIVVHRILIALETNPRRLAIHRFDFDDRLVVVALVRVAAAAEHRHLVRSRAARQ